jgi:hypothetical protein
VGEVTDDRARVTQAIVPEQKPVKGEEGVGYFVEGTALFELNRNLAETGLRLIAQVYDKLLCQPERRFWADWPR